MIALYFALCQAEFQKIGVKPVMAYVSEADKKRGFEALWVEQCVAKKEMGL